MITHRETIILIHWKQVYYENLRIYINDLNTVDDVNKVTWEIEI